MNEITQLSNIHSQTGETLLNFYIKQEAEREYVPLAPWRDGFKLKGSEIYTELMLLTTRKFSSNPNNKTSVGNSDSQNDSNLERGRSPDKNAPGQTSNKKNEFQYEERKSEPWGETFRGNGLRIILKGGAGSGKSFTLSQEVRQRLVKARTELENFNCPLDELEIPIFIKAGDLAESKEKNIEDALLEIIPGSSNHINFRVERWIRQAFSSKSGNRLFIVIDGLDELPEDSQGHFRDRMKQLDEQFKSASLIVSCRTMYFDARRDWISWASDWRTTIVELVPLEEKQQSELIEKLIGTGDFSRKTLSEFLKKNHSLSHFCRIPLVMSLACWLYAEGELLEETSYDSLYRAVTERILSGKWREAFQRPAWTKLETEVEYQDALDKRINLLSQICWNLFEASPSENRFTLKQWRAAYQKISGAGQTKKIDAIELLSELELVGMIINAGFDENLNNNYSFVHRTILEYFAARGLIETHKEEVWIKKLAKHLWCESAWVEVIRFAASITGNPSLLLQGVAKEIGYFSAWPRRFQGLNNFLNGLGSTLAFVSIIILFIAGIPILLSGKSRGQIIQYLSTLWQTFPDNLTKAASLSFSGLINVFSLIVHQLIDINNLIFEPLHEQALYIGWGWVLFITGWMQFLVPRLIILSIGMYVGSALTRLIRKILYPETVLKQDDVFRTGLRVQAEIIGLNNKVSRQDVRRVIYELLETEKAGEAKIHGATEEGGIPEDLLSILGSNLTARGILTDYWLIPIGIRRQKLWLYDRAWKILIKYFPHSSYKLISFMFGMISKMVERTNFRDIHPGDVIKDSQLSLALRGLFILPDTKAVDSLVKLADKSKIIATALHDARMPVKTFGELDVYIAKILANIGDSRGCERLAGLASRFDEKNDSIPLAIKELSLFDDKRAIEIAALGIKNKWWDDSIHYNGVVNLWYVLLDLPYERVISELNRLASDDKDYIEILMRFLDTIANETARKWLQKIAGDTLNPVLSDVAREKLKSSYSKRWVDTKDWLDEKIAEINQLIDQAEISQSTGEKKLEDVARKFDNLIASEGHLTIEGLLQNPEKIPVLCNDIVLDSWFQKFGHDLWGGASDQTYERLAMIGKSSNGSTVEEALIRWAKGETFDSEYEAERIWKQKLLLALGGLGSTKARETLLDILSNAHQKTRVVWRLIIGAQYNDFLLIALGKLKTEEALKIILRELNYPRHWAVYYVTARLLAERDDPKALELLLTGKSKRKSTNAWDAEFGEEPELRNLALQFGARIIKVNYEGHWEYVVVSHSRNFTCSIRL